MVLQLLMMGIDDVINFDFMDKPPKEVRASCFQFLHNKNRNVIGFAYYLAAKLYVTVLCTITGIGERNAPVAFA